MLRCGTGLVLCGLLLATNAAAPAHAQGIGIGPRITFVKVDDAIDDDSVRFQGIGLRFGGGKLALEASLDFHSRTDEVLGAEIKDRPFQLSALYFPVRSALGPYLLGGVGWFTRTVKPTGPASEIDEELSTTRMGYHAGGGLELKFGRRIGVYGDYRYTFLDLGNDDEEETSTPRFIPFAGNLGLSNEGSVWSWGLNFYF